MNTGGDGPLFVLTSSSESFAAAGVDRTFDDPRLASEQLKTGMVGAVVGALPFDLSRAAALTAPVRYGTAPLLPETTLPTLTATAERPAPDEHLRRVRRAVELIRAGELRKVVLARAVDFAADDPIEPLALAGALRRRDSSGNAFAVALDAAGAPFAGQWLVGCTPEVLVSRRGDRVVCHPLAGTATAPDGLLESTKDAEEHAYVVQEIAEALAPLCAELDVPAAPSVLAAGPVWHLGTRIAGRLRDPSTTALDLALALHPTAAVCGVPRSAAGRVIADLEGERGFYAGAVGWTTSDGDGHWRVAIRCAQIAADGRSLRAYAGGGIVGTSDPQAELAETANKLRTVLGPFRVTDPLTAPG